MSQQSLQVCRDSQSVVAHNLRAVSSHCDVDIYVKYFLLYNLFS